MISNAGLVSIIYPLLVFGYALLEENIPNRKFWWIVIAYTLFLLILKYIIFLQVLDIGTYKITINEGIFLRDSEKNKLVVYRILNMLPEAFILYFSLTTIY